MFLPFSAIRKYYDDCAQILTEHILAAVKPNSLKGFSTLDPLIIEDDHSFFQPSATLSRVARLLKGEPDVPPPAQTLSPARSDQSNPPNAATTLVEGAVRVRDLPNELTSEPASMCASSASSMDGETQKHVNKPMQRVDSSLGAHQEELRCVISVVRHGDRTPKQKLKVNITEPSILSYFQKHCVKPTKDLKVKAKAPMIEFLNTVRTILADKAKEKETGQDKDVDPDQKKKEKKLHNQLLHMRDILERWKFTGLNRKLQIKPRDWDQDEETGKKTCKEVQLVLKWGGNLTKLGENQAIRLGQRFRQEMYPDSSGGGILRLHSTFRHDMKIKTSDEGRVMKTAAAFAKGLLELEGEIPPILVSLVHKEKDSMHMLDPSGDKDAKLELDECKERITAHLQGDKDWREMTEEDRKLMVGPEEITSMRDSLAEVGNPRRTLMEIYRSMGYLIDQLEEMLGMMGSGDEKRIEGGEGLKGDDENDVVLSGVKLYKGETLLELTERWRFIHKRLYDPDEDTFDLSRIPDVHDNVRFDVLHNPHLGLSSTLEKLYELAKSMADCVVPQEYGTTIAEKRSVGINICSSLLEKIRYDLNIARTDNKADMRYMINMDYSADLPINTMGRRIRSRLYFTSESHLHTMLNVLRFAGVDENHSLLSEAGLGIINNTRELCYLTQIVIRLFEDTSIPLGDPKRFRAEILFSPGATATPLHMHDSLKIADTTRLDTAPLEVVGKDGLTCQEIEEFFGSAILESGSKVDDSASKASTVELGGCAPMGASFYNPNPPIPKLVENTEQENDELPGPLPIPEGTNGHKELPTDNEESFLDTDRQNTERTNSLTRKPPMMKNSCLVSLFQGPEEAPNANGYESPVLASTTGSSGGEPAKEEKDADNSPKKIDDEPHKELDSKYFWSTVAIGTMLLGASCLIMAMSLTGDSRNRRRYTRR